MGRFFSLFLLITFFASCSGISIISKKDLYSEQFLNRIEQVTKTFKSGKSKRALQMLAQLNDIALKPSEKAMKYNLKGVILFANNKLEESAEIFGDALKHSMQDKELNSKINLNLASVYFKLEQLPDALNYVLQVNHELLAQQDQEKTFRLRFILGQQLDRPEVVLKAVIHMEKGIRRLDDIRDSRFKSVLIENFAKLEETNRANFLTDMQDVSPLIVAFLAKEEVYKRYYAGDRDGAEDVLMWMERNFSDFAFVPPFIKSFERTIENYSKINLGAVGVVLPLSEERKVYGRRALKGIDLALDRVSSQTELGTPYILHVEDNKNNPEVARLKVRKLIENDNVSFIIGGLFSGTAKHEYLEAKKYGVLFLSLSPVFLPREEKDHLLIEVSGSIESQVERLMSEEVLNDLGRKVGVLYPKSERGEAYIGEVWKKYRSGNIEIRGIYGYEEGSTDLRDPVKNLLGLKFPRERELEKKAWKDIYELQERSAVRRIQTLPPETDFDWVYLISYPHIAQQIIPAFKYYDANRVIFVGGPSWKSRSMVERQRSFGSIYLVSDKPSINKRGFISGYNQRFGGYPRLIETLSYEAMNIGLKIVSNKRVESRDSLIGELLSQKSITGLTGSWSLDKGIWIKDLSLLNISGGQIRAVK